MTALAPALQARALKVRLGDRQVLGGLSLALPAGRWTAIVGPNGAGKSTLLRALAGMESGPGVQGEVELLGRPLRQWSARERACSLAWLGQNQPVAGDMRVQDVVMLGRLPHQGWLAAPSQADHAAVEQALRQTQGWDWRMRSVGSLSGGERQRVLLARALAVEAPLLLMDEPLASLDPPHQSDWLAIVRRHVARGGTAVSVLHEITMALHADALVVLGAGQVVHHGPCHDAATHRAVEQVFDGRLRVQAVGRQHVALPAEEIGT